MNSVVFSPSFLLLPCLLVGFISFAVHVYQSHPHAPHVPAWLQSCHADRLVKCVSPCSGEVKVQISQEGKGLGLLRNVDPKTSAFFSTAIDMSMEGLEWLEEPKIFWEAAQKDALEINVTADDYINNVRSNFDTFINSNVVHDREGLVRTLDSLMSRQGQFALVLGGVSTGKSLVLNNLRKRYNTGDAKDKRRLVLYLNGRLYRKQLAEGLLDEELELLISWDVYQEKSTPPTKTSAPDKSILKDIFKIGTQANLSNSKEFLSNARKILKFGGFKEEQILTAFTAIKSMNAASAITSASKLSPARTAMQRFVAFAEQKGLYPVIIIDEAHQVLGTNISDTQDVLEEIVQGTGSRRMNVILSTFQCSYPYQLVREGLNLANVHHVMVAGDISPRKTWDLYVKDVGEESDVTNTIDSKNPDSSASNGIKDSPRKTIGMGPHLTELCLSAYGGHLFYSSNAIWALSVAKEEFTAARQLPVLSGDIRTCLKTNGTRSLLMSMAEHGFVAVDTYQDAAVETIVRLNVGCILPRKKSEAEHLPENVWLHNSQFTDYGLIPSSHAARLSIARQLLLQ